MVRMLDGRSVEISLPNELGYERIAMACSASFARMIGFLPERIEDLKTAVSEACLNAMEHGNQSRPDARVVVRLEYELDALTIYVRDEGTGIQEIPSDPDIVKKIESLETPRGLGIFLIKQLADHVDFNQMTEDGHMIRMVIRMAVKT
jgi:serine/threonine-protein kinase RsbW